MGVTRAASVDCLFGDTNSTKTSRLGDAAEYYFEKTGKPAHLLCTDNAGWAPIENLVDEGIIIPFKVTMQRRYLIGDLSKLTQGWWPKDPENPLSELLARSQAPECSVLLLDGITNTCSMIMETHQQNVSVKDGVMTAADIKVPEMPKDSYVKSGDDYIRRFTGRSDYMGVQDRAVEFIRNLSMLPYPAVITALEAKGEDEQKKPIYGPMFIGKALTGICGPWFANLLHLDFMPQVMQVDDPLNPGKKISYEESRPVMFLRSHFDPLDPMKIKFPAKVRAPRTLHHKVPAVVPPDLNKLYKFLDSLREEEKASRKAVAIAVAGPVAV